MRFARVEGVTAERSGDRMVVLDAAGQTMTTLSPVGALIWDWLAAPIDLSSVVEQLHERFPDVERSVLASDAQRFLAELRTAELIVEADASG